MTILTTANSQNIHFFKSYGNSGYDYGRDIKQTPDTGYVATGSSSSFVSGNADAFLLKVDSLGNFEWSYNYGGNDSDWGNAVVITHDSSFAIGGYTNSYGAGGFDFFVVRADKNGIPLWQNTYGGTNWDKAEALAQNPNDSGFVIVGETYSFGAGNRDMYIVRTDKNGDTIWTKTYGGIEDDWATGVLIDGDSIVVCGGTESFGSGMSDGIIIKMHLDGTIGWTKVVGKELEDHFTSLVKFSASYYLGGTRDYHNGSWLNDFWMYRISNNGNLVQVDTTIENGSHEYEIAHDIVVAQLGNIYFAGQTKSFGYSTIDMFPDAYIGKLLDNYYTVYDYRQNFGEAGTDIAWGIERCYDDGIVAVGDMAYNSTGGNNMFIIKLSKTAVFPADTADYSIFGATNNPITLKIEPSELNNFITVYPNPASEIINIQCSHPIENISLYNLHGQLISRPEDHSKFIEMGQFEAGVYLLQITVESKIYSYKIIKN